MLFSLLKLWEAHISIKGALRKNWPPVRLVLKTNGDQLTVAAVS